jgi:hypothetical protein
VAIGIGRKGQDIVAGTDGNKFEARGNWGFSFVRRNSRVIRRILWSTFNVLRRSVTQNQVTFLNPLSQFSVVDLLQPRHLKNELHFFFLDSGCQSYFGPDEHSPDDPG